MRRNEQLERARNRNGRVVLGGVGLLAALGLVTAAAMPVDDEADVQVTRDTLEQWVETRRVLSKEKQAWKLGRELLEDRIQLVRDEVASLRERITEAEGSIAEADEKRMELLEENERYKQASVALEEMVTSLEARTKALLTRLPEPIAERVKPLSQRIPEDATTAKQSLGERFQNIVGILNEVNKFNGEITVTSEVRALADGTSAEVAALYIGIGQSYYASPSGTAGGVGRPGPDGWTWTEADQYAEDIRRAIAVLNNESPAEFVALPVQLTQGEGGQR